MANLPEVSQWESVYQLETTDPVVGGAGGISNSQGKNLANRTKYLKDQLESHQTDADPHPQYTTDAEIQAALGSQVIDQLPYPTIQTSGNVLSVSPASAVNGGTVSVAAGTYLSIAKTIVSTVSGRVGLYQTPAFTSADLAISTTYYLRGQIDGNGALVLYTTKGSDGDSIPSSLKGTINGASGGGFDSTVFDILLAKIVTGTSGTVPTVTAYRNINHYSQYNEYSQAVTLAKTWASYRVVSTNFARVPKHVIAALQGVSTNSVGELGTGSSANGQYVSQCGFRVTGLTRSGFTIEYVFEDQSGADSGWMRASYALHL